MAKRTRNAGVPVVRQLSPRRARLGYLHSRQSRTDNRRRQRAAPRASSAASASTLDSLSMELAYKLPMSKVVQLLAAIAPRGFALPKHLNLMSSDAGNRARWAELIIVLPTQTTPSPNASLRA
jgi:hypothetical protein